MALQEWNNKIADLINCGLNDDEIPGYFNAKEASEFIRDYSAIYRRSDSNEMSVLPAGDWTEHPICSRLEWMEEVASQETQLGYWAWVHHQLEAEANLLDHRGPFRLIRPGASIELSDFMALVRCIKKLLPGAGNLDKSTSLHQISELVGRSDWSLLSGLK